MVDKLKEAFAVAIEELKLIEPLKNVNWSESDKSSCLLFDDEFNHWFKIWIFNMVRELSGIENFEVTSKLVKRAFVVAIKELKPIVPSKNRTISEPD